MSHASGFLAIATSTLAALLIAAPARAQPTATPPSGQTTPPPDHGRFLPGKPNIGLQDFRWASRYVQEFSADVNCGSTILGTVKFSYDLFRGKTASGKEAGGAALVGGFWSRPDVCVNPGWRLTWTQVVDSPKPGRQEWGADGTYWWPDTNNGRTSPEYPGTSLPRLKYPPNPPPNVPFQDFPYRFFQDGSQAWVAQLALVALNDSTKEACLIGQTNTWGFNIIPSIGGQPPDVQRVGDVDWYNEILPEGALLQTLTDGFDGNGLERSRIKTSTPWTFTTDCCDEVFCVTPAPSSLALLGVGGMVTTRRRRVA